MQPDGTMTESTWHDMRIQLALGLHATRHEVPCPICDRSLKPLQRNFHD